MPGLSPVRAGGQFGNFPRFATAALALAVRQGQLPSKGSVGFRSLENSIEMENQTHDDIFIGFRITEASTMYAFIECIIFNGK